MRLSVVIPAYNHLDKVLRCVNTLRASGTSSVETELIVQDDASPDYNLAELIPSCAAGVNRNKVNLGFNGNVNAGVKKTTGELIALVNQDVFAIIPESSDWNSEISVDFNDPAVGIVGPKLLFPNGTIQSAGGLFDAKGQPYHRCLGYSDINYPEVNTPQEVTWVTGAFLVIRRELWDKLGGFDPVFAPAYFEDADLCLRARELGYKVQYEPRATFVHEVGSTGGSPHFHRSAMAFKAKWVDSGRVKPDVPMVREGFW